MRPFRIFLFVPGDRPDRFAKAVAAKPDAVILDLEDAVSADMKKVARTSIRQHSLPASRVLVRINSPATEDFALDLQALRDVPLAGVVVAKSERARDLRSIGRTFAREVPLFPLIESAAGLANAGALLRVPGVVAAAFGSMDFANDLGCTPDWEELLLARSELVLHSRAARREPPIDGISTALDDSELVEVEARRVMRLGFGGKLAVHPRQIPPIVRGFAPDVRWLQWAQRIVESAGSGAQRIAGELIDTPIVERAQRILAAAQQASRRAAGHEPEGCEGKFVYRQD